MCWEAFPAKFSFSSCQSSFAQSQQLKANALHLCTPVAFPYHQGQKRSLTSHILYVGMYSKACRKSITAGEECYETDFTATSATTVRLLYYMFVSLNSPWNEVGLLSFRRGFATLQPTMDTYSSIYEPTL